MKKRIAEMTVTELPAADSEAICAWYREHVHLNPEDNRPNTYVVEAGRTARCPLCKALLIVRDEAA